MLAGPTCARTLAEQGADVLRITAPHLPDSGPMEIDTGIGKLSAHLDLRSPAEVETLRGLLREADVFSQSYRPGTLAARATAAAGWCASRSRERGSGSWTAAASRVLLQLWVNSYPMN